MENKKEPTKISVLIKSILFAVLSTLFGLILSLILVFIGGFVVELLKIEVTDEINLIITYIGLILGAIAAGIYVIKNMKKEHGLIVKDKFSLKKINYKFFIGIILSLITFARLLEYFLQEVIKLKPTISPDLSFTLSGYLLIIMIVLVAPIFEEIVFRFGIIEKLETKYSKLIAILISAVLFSAIHFYGLAGSIVVFAIGAILASIYSHTRNLIYVMVIHFINNAMSAVQAIVSKTDPESIVISFPSSITHILILVAIMFVGIFMVYKEKDKAKFINQIKV